MNTQLKIGLFTLAVTGFYTYVGQIVPQMEAHPPKTTKIGADMSPAELVEAGQKVFYGKGTCALCHTIGGKGERCPDLAGVGAVAASRVEDQSPAEYLAQSLYDPNSYVVEGYAPTMPRVDRPPIALDALEIVAVVAFLESNGGEVTVTPGTRFEGAEASEARPEAPTGATGPLDPEALIAKYNCGACHRLDGPERLLGPSLWDVGTRLDPAAILQSIVDPDAVMTEGAPPYPAGLMGATLGSNGFYEDVSLAELSALASHLSTQTGGSD